MNGMKLRLMAMGSIVSVLAIVLLLTIAFRFQFELLFGVGIVILVAGLFWKQPRPKATP